MVHTVLLSVHLLVSLALLKMMWSCLQRGMPLVRHAAFNRIWVLCYFLLTVCLPLAYGFVDTRVVALYMPPLVHQAIQIAIELFIYKKVQRSQFHRFFISEPITFVFARAVFTAFLLSLYDHVLLYILLGAHIIDFQIVMANLTRYLLDDTRVGYAKGSLL